MPTLFYDQLPAEDKYTPMKRRHYSWFLALLLIRISSPLSQAYSCTQFDLAPHTQWRITTHNEVFWLLTPCGERWYSLGVNVVNGGYPSRLFQERLSYHWPTYYTALPAWAQTTRQRLLTWGFNTAGAWSAPIEMLQLPTIPDLEIGRESRFHWFDPFRPSMEEEMRTWAQDLVAPYKGKPYRIGYFSDNEIGWWYGAMLIYYLKQPPDNYTKQRLIALLRSTYAEDWQRFMGDFVPPQGVTSFDDLLQHTGVGTQLRIGGAGIHVIRRWVSIVAERYYSLVHRVLREADPEALIFADRLQIYYDPDAIRMMAPYVDAVATNYDVDSHDGWVGHYYFDGLHQLTGGKPIVVSEWFFAAQENRSGNRNNGHLMTVPTQAERAQGAMAAARNFARKPHILGSHWFQYYDHPQGGRPDGEDYNFGLVDLDDRPYEQLVTAFAMVNPQLAALHQAARPTPSGTVDQPLRIPQATIHPDDHSLREWPKERAYVPGMKAAPGEVVFGDMYVAWNAAGLYLGTVSMDYYDPLLLAYGNTFPLEEAFRLDWGIDAGAGARRFALYIIPPKEYPRGAPPLTRAYLCQHEGASCAPVPNAIATYFGADTPRISAEVLLPWQALGLRAPPASQTFRMELAATSYHRARWMSWSGQAPTAAMHDPASWAKVHLSTE